MHRGAGVATLGGRESHGKAGATIYIPRNTTISLVNSGTEPLGIAFVFSKPGFEELMRLQYSRISFSDDARIASMMESPRTRQDLHRASN